LHAAVGKIGAAEILAAIGASIDAIGGARKDEMGRGCTKTVNASISLSARFQSLPSAARRNTPARPLFLLA
jgi:hypothetical protein